MRCILAHALLLATLAFAGRALAGPGGPGGLGVNLIANPGAETGSGSHDGSIVKVPGWSTTGNFTAVAYGASDESGAFPCGADPGPLDPHENLFAGGPENESSSASQLIELAVDSTVIDAGHVTYDLSGYFGGFADHRDHAVLSATFLDAHNAPLATATLGPVTVIDRESRTALLPRSKSGSVPAGTRCVRIELNMTRLDGKYNDGYADELSLILQGPNGKGQAGPEGREPWCPAPAPRTNR
jgi:hypothetical protein